MAFNQFTDIPQLQLSDDSPLGLWSIEYFGYPMHLVRQESFRTITHRDDMGYGEMRDQSMSSMEPMQRFLHGYDTQPHPLGLLQAKLDNTLTQSHPLRLYERPWPSVENLAYSPRNGSPDRTSDSENSSQGLPTELRSPHPILQAPCGSPSEFSQPLSFPPAELLIGGTYAPELPGPGQGINLREIEYAHQDIETAIEDQDHEDTKHDFDYDQESIYPKGDHVSDAYQNYPDPAARQRDPESVQPLDRTDADSSDSDYKPFTNKTNKKRRSSASSSGSGRQSQKRSKHGRKSSTTSSHSTSNKVTKKTRGPIASPTSPRGAIPDDADQRPFPCPLASYGCLSDFSSKNEWKRHVSTQHVKLGFWRCDLCTTTVNPSDNRTIYHNDFNRKDLFTQHLRRMHAAPIHKGPSARNPKEYQVSEDNLVDHQKRCYKVLRLAPQQSSCLFCNHDFSGPSSWDERMEHVGRHLEKDRKSGGVSTNCADWRQDKVLENYLLEEGLIVQDRNGGWKIGDGKPHRHSGSDSDEESDIDN
ncbi:hypothetical protein CC78DRAFT_132951 [Lojkania enalia]|uniref:C2H2-type domain-containing protein n=1 Tax=Lojkania enalia TaxID=147567 RepID=A0A9P4TQ92_9PLEO|nr:hypothetical protein CC78DRAFT_132951 [Didymosphaeria enalia]